MATTHDRKFCRSRSLYVSLFLVVTSTSRGCGGALVTDYGARGNAEPA